MLDIVMNQILSPGLLNNQLELLFGGVCLMVWALLFIVGILLCIWVYRDAESRGMSGVLWLIVVLILGIIGLIVYLVVRKPKVTAPPVYGGMAPQPGYAPPQGYVAAPPPGYQGAPPYQPAYGAPQPAAVACRYCGSPVPPGSVVCPRCGGRL